MKINNLEKFINYDGIIFDIDGVLVDVKKSYRLAIEKTVNYFIAKFKIKINQKEIDLIKNLQGFNSDWDVSYVIIDLLSKRFKKQELKDKAKPLSSFIKKQKKYKEIRNVFQMFYLGNKLFETIENKKAFWKLKGLIFEEKLLISEEILKELSLKTKLGIVTGRPRKEALFTIKYFNLDKFFPLNNMIAREDYKKEKPNPDPLLKVKEAMNIKKPIYIGDSINDVIAAEKASIFSIYIGEENLGDIRIKDINQIKEVFKI